MADEMVTVCEDETEVVVRLGVFFKEGSVAVSVFDVRGVGATAYVAPAQAEAIGKELLRLSHPGRTPGGES